MVKKAFVLLMMVTYTLIASTQELYINVKTGNDANPRSKLQPLKTIGEAAKRLNINNEKETATIFLAEGVYPLTETVLFNNNKFTAEHRLTIRAERLPDDPNWNPQHMPIITTVV